MTKIRIAKFAGVAAGATLLLGSFVPMAGAQTASELQAQINALMAQLANMNATPSASYQFNTNLTVGSRGADVSALQQILVSKGYLQMPAGVAFGYFGTLTKSAVARWQAASGIYPAVGYFGPISRAAIATQAGGTVTSPTCPVGFTCTSPTPVTCPAGFTCTPTGGTTGTTGTVSGVITTPGVEATLTASLNPSPASGTKLFESDMRRAVLGIKLEAQTGDVRVERLRLKLDAATSPNSDQDFFRKIATRIYVMDGSTVLASADLNTNTVVQEGSDYYITITGFGYVVPKDSTRVLTVALDANSNWDSTFDTDSWTITVPADGVRGIDGAGINQYSPTTAFARSFTSEGNLTDTATLAISLSSTSPEVSQKICTSGTNENECDNLEVLRADFRAEKDTVMVTDLTARITRTNNATPVATNVATATTAYLYDGSTLVGSASVTGTGATTMDAVFTDIDWSVPIGTTRTLSLRLDIDTAQLAADSFSASIANADVTDENSSGASVVTSGSAVGRAVTVRNVGPEITLVSKSITTSGVPQSSAANTLSTSTLTATFNVRVKALGADLHLGTVASTTGATSGPAFPITLANNSFRLYSSGVASSVNNATSSSYTIPTTCVTAVPANTCTLAENAEVVIPITYLVPGRAATGAVIASGLYAVGLEKVNWAPASTGALQSTSFMTGLIDWRTADVSFP